MPGWLIFARGKWWKVGICADHLWLVFGWSFERCRIGIEAEWCKQRDQTEGMRRHRHGFFLPLSRRPDHRRLCKPSTSRSR